MKKECIEEQMLWEYIDDELCVNGQYKVKQHLNDCPSCTQKYREIRSFESQLMVGFNNDFFDCSDIPSLEVRNEKHIESSLHNDEYSILWQRLIASAILALVAAIVVIAMISPYVHGVPMEIGFNWLRFFIFSLIALALKPVSMLVIGVVGAIGAGWSLIGARH